MRVLSALLLALGQEVLICRETLVAAKGAEGHSAKLLSAPLAAQLWPDWLT